MAKHAIQIVGAILIVALAALVLSQRQSIVKLREKARASEIATENAAPSYPAEQITTFEARSTEPTSELLRLRGEVVRLRQDHNQVEKLRREVENLRTENRWRRGPTINESYAGDLDTNSLPEIEMGATKDEVSAELRRVGATILTEDENFIHAQAFPAVLASSNGALATIKMELYFDEGKLSSRKDSPTWSKASNPQ
jgi:hypothetical protein